MPLPLHEKIYNDERVPPRAKLVYLHLSDRQGSKEEAWPGIDKMAHDLSISRSTVIRAIADLVRLGYIEKQAAFRPNSRAQTSNRYKVIR
jgi:DNA-binding transcriptional MocR family regulator